MSAVFLNDRIVEAALARIDPADRGLLHGDGVFETFRAGAPSRWTAHLERLGRGAAVLGIPLPMAELALAEAVAATIAANGLADGGAVRVTLTRGPGPRGLLPPESASPTLLIAAAPYAPEQPFAAATIALTRRNERSPLAAIKSLNNLDNVLAQREARQRGFEEALLLNTAGRLAGAARGNLFLSVDGALYTPPVSEGALPGIVRALVIAELAPALGVVVRETAIDPAELARAGEAFITNSLLGVRGLRRVDGVRLPEAGPLAVALGEAYEAASRR